MAYSIAMKILNSCGKTAKPFSNSKGMVYFGRRLREFKIFLEVEIRDWQHNNHKIERGCVAANLECIELILALELVQDLAHERQLDSIHEPRKKAAE